VLLLQHQPTHLLSIADEGVWRERGKDRGIRRHMGAAERVVSSVGKHQQPSASSKQDCGVGYEGEHQQPSASSKQDCGVGYEGVLMLLPEVPPPPDPCIAVCPAPLPPPHPLPLAPPLQACISMKPRVDMDISGSDIPCKSNQFCQVCGGLETVKNGCMQDNRCVAAAVCNDRQRLLS
jgi:hypothetical protein